MNNLFTKVLSKLATAASLAIATSFAAFAVHTETDVDQVGLKFTKKTTEVKAGGVVTFHNSDDVIHNIMTIDENDMTEDYGLQKPGETIKTKFEQQGEFQVRCSIHPKMKMTISVTK